MKLVSLIYSFMNRIDSNLLGILQSLFEPIVYTAKIYIPSTSPLQLQRCTLHLSVVHNYRMWLTTSPLHLSVVIITTIQMQFALHPYIHENYISWLYTEKTYISNTTGKMYFEVMYISTTTEKLPTSLLQLERCSLRIYTSLP